MNKIIISLIVFFISIWNIYASEYKLTSKDKIIVNKLTSKIQNLLSNNNLTFRINLENKINELQLEYKNIDKIFYIFQEIKKNTYLINYKNEYTNHYKLYSINFDQIKDNWLNWHNTARKNLWKVAYSYDERLDNTAYNWSKEQNWKWIMSHKRTSTGPYYDYKQIEKWFNNRWVRCEIKWWTTTSESIWKFWYYCNSNDCTNKLSESLKVIFDIYMAEKWLWYPANAHYRWIISDNLSKIWLWISIRKTNEKDYYEYYVTTHYCTKFKK